MGIGIGYVIRSFSYLGMQEKHFSEMDLSNFVRKHKKGILGMPWVTSFVG